MTDYNTSPKPRRDTLTLRDGRCEHYRNQGRYGYGTFRGVQYIEYWCSRCQSRWVNTQATFDL